MFYGTKNFFKFSLCIIATINKIGSILLRIVERNILRIFKSSHFFVRHIIAIDIKKINIISSKKKKNFTLCCLLHGTPYRYLYTYSSLVKTYICFNFLCHLSRLHVFFLSNYSFADTSRHVHDNYYRRSDSSMLC